MNTSSAVVARPHAMKLRWAAAAVASVIGAALLAPPAGAKVDPIDILVYSATYGFRHASIDTANAEFVKLGKTAEFDVDTTTDPSRISAEGLAPYDVLAFINATGEQPFSEQQRQEFLAWLDDGHGFVGTHASADGNYYWSEYGDVLGAYFLAHPHTGEAINNIEDPTSPFLEHFTEPTYNLEEEYYRFQLDPRPNVHVLTSLDRSTAGPEGNTYVADQPTTWCQEVGGGRSFYTAWGHFDESFTNPDVWQMLLQGIRWAGYRMDADCSPTEPMTQDFLQAEEADPIAFAHTETSTEEGAEQDVTAILQDGALAFRRIDLTGVTELNVHLSVETSPDPKPYHLPQPSPAVGGVIHMRIDGVNSGQAGEGCPFSGQCTEGVDVAEVVVNQDAPGWKTLTTQLTEPVTGVHDVFFVFSEDFSQNANGTRLFVPELTDERYLFSIDWLQLPGAKDLGPKGPGDDGEQPTGGTTGTGSTTTGTGTGTGATGSTGSTSSSGSATGSSTGSSTSSSTGSTGSTDTSGTTDGTSTSGGTKGPLPVTGGGVVLGALLLAASAGLARRRSGRSSHRPG